ncbi:MAG: HD domain-containing phosphohydrolase [Gemmatimonadaceae bacterium]
MLNLMAPLMASLAGLLYLRERRTRMSLARLGAAALESLLDAIDANDTETGAHVRRVADYSLILGEAAGLDARTLHSIERVALFHDIGKIHGALTDLLNETKHLNPAEHRAIKTHPRRGAEVLEPLARFYPDLTAGVLSHHERWDGSGYPRKLRGGRIPMAARVVAIADTFDAVTHARAYSHARSLEAAKLVIVEGRGTQFDPDLADLFLSPLVIESIAKSMRSLHMPRRKQVTRRKAPRTNVARAPDVRFRWRIARPSRLQPGR